jgi:hypothetical protein
MYTNRMDRGSSIELKAINKGEWIIWGVAT